MPKNPKYTFALIKPEAAGTTTEDAVIKMITDKGFQILQRLWIAQPTPTQAASHFESLRHRRAEAFDRNFPHLLRGPVTALQIQHPNPETNVVEALRTLVGPTNPIKAPKSSIRGRFAKDSIAKATRENRALRNVIHCSDSAEAAYEETQIWFHQRVSPTPKASFTLEDNNGGDQITIEVLPNNQLQLKVDQCCVPRWEGEIPVSHLIDALVQWEENYKTQGHKTRPDLVERTKFV